MNAVEGTRHHGRLRSHPELEASPGLAPVSWPRRGTCINEAAIVACGFPYQSVASVGRMPDCFSRPICQFAMRLNDEATDEERRRLLPFVTRLACADTPEIELERARYIDQHINFDRTLRYHFSFDRGLAALEGALAIGRQADPLGLDVAASRLEAVRPRQSRIGRTPASCPRR
ncbi:hypothetical protein ACRAWG_06530 [Methylobacterium sp. P31]